VELEGSVTISRRTSNQEPAAIVIAIEDSASGVVMVEASMNLADFASAITGLGAQDAKLSVRGLDRIGSTLEVKREVVEFNAPHSSTADLLKRPPAVVEALAPFEVDGWIGDPSDLGNHHRRTKDGRQSVTFRRWVKPEVGIGD